MENKVKRIGVLTSGGDAPGHERRSTRGGPHRTDPGDRVRGHPPGLERSDQQ